MDIVGNKIKKYITFTCGNCHESMEVDLKDLIAEGEIATVYCPWCENTLRIYTPGIEEHTNVRIVKID